MLQHKGKGIFFQPFWGKVGIIYNLNYINFLLLKLSGILCLLMSLTVTLSLYLNLG